MLCWQSVEQISGQRILAILAVALLLIVDPSNIQACDCRPERIVLTVSEQPQRSQTVSWQTARPCEDAGAQVMGAGDFERNRFTPVPGKVITRPETGQPPVYHHTVTFTGLEPDTPYLYRVGNHGCRSEWNSFVTAKAAPAEFTFLYFGDLQTQVLERCAVVVRQAFKAHPDAAFWVFGGDLVDDGEDDSQWNDFFSGLGWIARTVPLAPVAGNHEYPDPRRVPRDQRRITPLWQGHFTLPVNGPPGLEGTVYTFDYQGACFIILNGNEKLERQARWMDRVLEENRQPWVIVCIHQPVYSISERRRPAIYRDLLVPVIDRHAVDLVLQGHDHGYSRTYPLKNHRPVEGKGQGTVYVISNAGPKFYPPGDDSDGLMAVTAADMQLVQAITVSGPELRYRAQTITGKVVDSFTRVR